MTVKESERQRAFGHKLTTRGNYKRLRNLNQYKDLTDDEFEELWDKKLLGIESNKEFEGRIERKIKEFGVDYDLDDLKANDKLTLRGLAQAYITLEDLENYFYGQRLVGIDDSMILGMEKMNNMMSNLRRDITNMQNDLKITRRIRKGDKEESVINYIEDLKVKARKFYQSKMAYIFCPECGMLLATVWTLFPESKNKINLTCNRSIPPLGDATVGTKCGCNFTVITKELVIKGSNRPELMPEALS